MPRLHSQYRHLLSLQCVRPEGYRSRSCRVILVSKLRVNAPLSKQTSDAGKRRSHRRAAPPFGTRSPGLASVRRLSCLGFGSAEVQLLPPPPARPQCPSRGGCPLSAARRAAPCVSHAHARAQGQQRPCSGRARELGQRAARAGAALVRPSVLRPFQGRLPRCSLLVGNPDALRLFK